jgi:prepilin-type N-terminal cleavage/methylation domain-containing protein
MSRVHFTEAKSRAARRAVSLPGSNEGGTFMNRLPRAAFTIVEMLVVISIIGLLLALLLPAVNNARDQARITESRSNLRNLGTAHQNYASDHEGRQFTLAVDSIASYGIQAGDPGPQGSAEAYNDSKGKYPPGIALGWATRQDAGTYGLYAFNFGATGAANRPLMAPLVFDSDPNWEGFGWFRIPNARPFNQYVGKRFYDPVFYAPKDVIVTDYVKQALEAPEEYVPTGVEGGNVFDNGRIGWSSYSLSPAALFDPRVLANPDRGGFVRPWEIPAGMRAPAMSQALYSSLKTHMIEHHWLQGRKSLCNPAFSGGSYDGCEPYYFNHSVYSAPNALFYDGHISSIGVQEAMQADSLVLNQTNHDYGLWSRDTPWGTAGYFIGQSYDNANTSFHILTTDGIRGRDVLSAD